MIALCAAKAVMVAVVALCANLVTFGNPTIRIDPDDLDRLAASHAATIFATAQNNLPWITYRWLRDTAGM